MGLSKWIAVGTAALVLASGASLAVGDVVYNVSTKLHCRINSDAIQNTPNAFFTSTYNSGPFRGEGWNRWVKHDLSDWWLETDYSSVRIEVAEGVKLAGWWIAPDFPNTQKTVIVTHGLGNSKHDYSTLLPAAMLVKAGFNVLVVDQRNTGESTCVDGRHSAGQQESSDFVKVADWLVTDKGIKPESIGMYGVSGGAILTSLMAAKTENISAFALEGSIFDFDKAATDEAEMLGLPGFVWELGSATADIFYGVNLTELTVAQSLKQAGARPFLVLHGEEDKRLDFQGSVEFKDYAESIGVPVQLESFVGADHTEGMLTEPQRYARLLSDFFDASLLDLNRSGSSGTATFYR
jgi:dipeptidyl aminopeptidase/acylaminoacyl peptidase